MNDLAQCPICKETDFLPYLSCKDYTVSSQTFQLLKCAGCGFVVTSPRPDEAMLPAYYQSAAYISHSNSSMGLMNHAYKIARTFTSKWKYKIVHQHCTQKPESLLDFGCGTGSFLKHCKNKGLAVAGVEPSDVARRQAEQTTGEPIASDIGQVSRKFDAITLWHVLEHVYDLNATIQTLKSRLNNKGTMFIAVPNHRSFDANLYAKDWAAYDVPRHLWHFSKQTMERLLKKSRSQTKHRATDAPGLLLCKSAK